MHATNWSKSRRLGGWLLPCALALVGCESKSGTPQQVQRTEVYTTFYPTTYFAERIAGGHVRIVNPCPPDADPAYWMPTDETVAAYQSAALIVINGAAFEKWVEKVNLPATRLVDTTRPLAGELIQYEDAVTHRHGPSGEAHAHAGTDGHTWPDPVNCQVQAEELLAALTRTFPEHAGEFQENHATLSADLAALDQRLRSLSEKIADQTLLAAHPAYNYLARRYGWNIKSFHLDPEEMPDDETLATITTAVEHHAARIMLWESEPRAEIAERLATECGLRSVVYSPCESQPDAGDFLTVMNANVDRLAALFSEE